jgi:hypothetical protein
MAFIAWDYVTFIIPKWVFIITIEAALTKAIPATQPVGGVSTIWASRPKTD